MPTSRCRQILHPTVVELKGRTSMPRAGHTLTSLACEPEVYRAHGGVVPRSSVAPEVFCSLNEFLTPSFAILSAPRNPNEKAPVAADLQVPDEGGRWAHDRCGVPRRRRFQCLSTFAGSCDRLHCRLTSRGVGNRQGRPLRPDDRCPSARRTRGERSGKKGLFLTKRSHELVENTGSRIENEPKTNLE